MSPNCCCSCSCSSTTSDDAASSSMAEEKKPNNNSIISEFETRIELLQKWAAKQSLPVEAAVATAIGTAGGAITGFLVDVVKETIGAVFSIQTPATGRQLDQEKLARCGGYRPLVYSFLAASRLEWARNYAVLEGVDAGITCVMKKLRGEDDIHTQMVAAFGSAVAVSLVTGVRGPEVLKVGVMFALMTGMRFKLKQESSQDVLHDKIRDILSSKGLGVDHYGTNYNTRTFADNALSLLCDRKEMKK